jgi:CBS-domain-containing membrane protein
MQVVDMMRKTVITATADMSLAQAQQRMQEHRVRHLPVCSSKLLRHCLGRFIFQDIIYDHYKFIYTNIFMRKLYPGC